LKRTGAALEVVLDGTKRRSFVEAKLDWQRPTFGLSFVIDPRSVELGQGEVELLRLLGPRPHVSLSLVQQGSKYFVALWAREGGGALKLFGRTRVPARRAVRLELDWFRASSSEADDGEVRLAKNGRVRALAANLANGDESIQSIRFGLPAGSEGLPGGGRFLLDEVVATP
jgi:hypothetical protein